MSFAGFVFLCFLGIAAAGEEPLPPPPPGPHHHNHHDLAHVTTVCIQMQGPHNGPMCGPLVPPPDGQPGLAGRSSEGPVASLKAGAPYRFEQPPPVHQRTVPENAVFQDYYQGVPVYQLQPARASQPNQPPPAGLKPPGSLAPCDQQNAQFKPPSQPPQLRTLPFAPFGIDDATQSRMAQNLPLTSSGMRSAQQQPMVHPDIRMAQQFARQSQQTPVFQTRIQPQLFARMMPQNRDASGFMGVLPPSEIYGSAVQMMRAASDCPDGQNEQPLQQQRAVIKGVPPQAYRSSDKQDSQSNEEWKRQCDEKEVEIQKKTDEINELKKQLERMAALAEKSATTAATVSTKSASLKEQADEKDLAADNKKEEILTPQNQGLKKKRSEIKA